MSPSLCSQRAAMNNQILRQTIAVAATLCVIAPALAGPVSGSAVAWGNNAQGQTNVPPPNANILKMASGYFFNIGLLADGSVIGWGGNESGQLNVPRPNSSFVAVAAGNNHSLGLKSDGSVI